MNKLLLTIALLCGTIGLVGCRSADRAELFSIGQDHRVVKWSGGKVVRIWYSSGKVVNETDSDGYYFMNKATGLLVRTSGDVDIEIVDDDMEPLYEGYSPEHREVEYK